MFVRLKMDRKASGISEAKVDGEAFALASVIILN